MNPADLPVARELFKHWQRARGNRTEPALRPFSRNWEELLEEARLISAIERGEAERDAVVLESAGWIDLHKIKYRPHFIHRISIPLEAEARWREAFGFVPPSNEEARQIREYSWQPELSFLRETRLQISFAELQQLDAFLQKNKNANLEVVPIKERSLQIFGDEKRLDMLLSSALFRFDRLDLRRNLHCEIIGVPLAWKRGPARASAQPIIALENASTWHTYCRWNSEKALFSAVVYGDGNRFVDGIRYLKDLFEELGGQRPIFYFGDLDPQGLLIPHEASGKAQALGLPTVQPHLWSYRQLLKLGQGHEQPWEGEPASETLFDWLEDCAPAVRALFASGKRLAQERLGWEVLPTQIEG